VQSGASGNSALHCRIETGPTTAIHRPQKSLAHTTRRHSRSCVRLDLPTFPWGSRDLQRVPLGLGHRRAMSLPASPLAHRAPLGTARDRPRSTSKKYGPRSTPKKYAQVLLRGTECRNRKYRKASGKMIRSFSSSRQDFVSVHAVPEMSYCPSFL
jgi:hypothetical protein